MAHQPWTAGSLSAVTSKDHLTNTVTHDPVHWVTERGSHAWLRVSLEAHENRSARRLPRRGFQDLAPHHALLAAHLLTSLFQLRERNQRVCFWLWSVHMCSLQSVVLSLLCPLLCICTNVDLTTQRGKAHTCTMNLFKARQQGITERWLYLQYLVKRKKKKHMVERYYIVTV